MRPDTKHARILAILRMPTETTIAAIMTATDWQQHSVRSFHASVVRKKLGLNLVSEQTDKGRVYRIMDEKGYLHRRSREAGGVMPDAATQPTPQDNQLMSKHRVLSMKP